MLVGSAVAAALRMYVEDGVRVGALGDVVCGRAAIEAAYERTFRHAAPGAYMTQERGEIRRLASDLASWRGAFAVAAERSEAQRKKTTQR